MDLDCSSDKGYEEMAGKILLIGGGGYCKQVIEIIREDSLFDDIGIVEKDNTDEYDVLGEKIVGADYDLEHLFCDGWNNAFVSLGSVGNTKGRRKIFNILKEIGFFLPPIISKSANVAKSATVRDCSIIHQGAIIDADVSIGCCSIINKGCILSHDCIIGDFVHVSPGCTLLGNVKIGDDSHIGAASSVREGISIGKETMIGMGSIVVKNIPDRKLAYGNPCEVKGER